MNQMEIFKNPEFGSIRTFEQDGKVLFCGTDVAAALGYANPRKAVRDHTRCGTKCSVGVQTGKKADGSPAVQMVEMLFIPEGDVYRLIVHSLKRPAHSVNICLSWLSPTNRCLSWMSANSNAIPPLTPRKR